MKFLLAVFKKKCLGVDRIWPEKEVDSYALFGKTECIEDQAKFELGSLFFSLTIAPPTHRKIPNILLTLFSTVSCCSYC